MQGSFGVLYGDIDEIYSNLGQSITKLPHSFVGVFYPTSGRTTMILFRTFDGTRITYFGNYLTIERLAQSTIIRKLETCSFNEEFWTADGNDNNLCDCFCRNINRVLLYSGLQQDHESLLRYLVGLNVEKPVNGYQIVNDIILSTTSIDPRYRDDHSTSQTIIENRYLHQWVIHDISGNSNTHDDFRMDSEVKSSIRQLTQTFSDLILKDSEYSKRINSIITTNKSQKSPLPFEYVSKMKIQQLKKESVGVEDEMSYFKETIEDIMTGFTTSHVPVINIAELTDMYNRLATKLKQPKINLGQGITKHRSIGLLAQSTSFGFHPDNVEIKLKSGQSVILPTKYENFSTFTDDELIQFHRYIKSFQVVDGRFNYIIERIIKELAFRASF